MSVEINRQSATQNMLALFPDFEYRWNTHRVYWDDASPGICLDMAEMSNWTAELIKGTHVDRLKLIFETVENLLVHGDEETANAAATCFLENLLNITPGDLDPALYIHLLGSRSRDYCKAWDSFTGVKTDGLWD